MYDKSKKTWSQRLKISKNEKSTVAEEQTQGGAVGGQGLGANGQTTQNASQAGASKANSTRNMQALHLQALQMQQQPQLNLSEYHVSNGGVVVGPPPGYEFLPSALSRSMKFAEPWIYGTVRGIPARPYHHQMAGIAGYHGHHPHAAAIFAATTSTHPLASAEHALAVVICSCSEYLNGTKRDVKKASVCKKCKGSRLPLTTITGTGGGTVRLPAATALSAGTKLRGAATMRVVSSTKKSRPTILDPQKDPYDLMRRTRLLSPEPGGAPLNGGGGAAGSSAANDVKSRSRGKSVSPQRGRSRTRTSLPPLKLSSSKKEAPKPPERLTENNHSHEDDVWLVDDNESLLSGNLTPQPGHSRRSILRCNVNPYDLISIETAKPTDLVTLTTPTAFKSNASTPTPPPSAPISASTPQVHEFLASSNDEFNVADAALVEDEPPFATNSKITLTEPEHKFYSSNVQAIAGQRISLGDQRATKKSFIKQSTDGRSYESIEIATNVTGEKYKQETIKPKSVSINQQLQKQQQQQQQVTKKQQQQQQQQPKRPPRQTKKTDTGSDNSALDGAPIPAMASATETTKPVAAETPSDEEETVTVLTVTPTQSIKSILKRPTTLEIGQNLPTIASDKTAPVATPTTPLTSASTTMTAALLTPTTKSQFYIPLPQTTSAEALTLTPTPTISPTTSTTRKKVQFMVEDKIIQVSTTSSLTPTVDNAPSLNRNSNNSILNDNANGAVEAKVKSADVELNEDNVDNNDANYSNADVGQDDNGSDEDQGYEIKYALRGTNYEYYKRKRGQQKLLQQQQKQQQVAKVTAINSNEKSTNQNVEGCCVDVDADARATDADQLEINSWTSNRKSAMQEINAANADDENKLKATTTSNIKADSFHYEDVLKPPSFDSSMKQIFNNSESAGAEMPSASSVSNTDTKLLSPTRSHVGSPAPARPKTTPTKSAATLTPTTPIVEFVTDDDADTAPASVIVKREHQAAWHGEVMSLEPGLDQHATKDALKRSIYGDARLLSIERTKKSPASSEQTTTTLKAQQPRNPIRRAHSERHMSAPSTSSSHEPGKQQTQQGRHNGGKNKHNNSKSQQNVILNFKDTMALRVKSNRNDSRDLFQRPKEPPPPPPPPTPLTPTTDTLPTDENIKQVEEMKTVTPQGQQQQADTAILIPIPKTTTTTMTTAFVGKQPVAETTDGLDHRQAVGESSCQSSAARATENAKSQSEINGLNFDSNANHGIRLQSHLKDIKSKQQRTVVRVAPFNKTSSEIHRLKICHTDTDVNNRHQQILPASDFGHSAHIIVDPLCDPDTITAEQQKKTSILINGDDCYSTMNLSSDTAQPLYQSSVVVADASNGSAIYGGLSVRTNTSNTVTINVCSPHTSQYQQQQQQQQRSSEEELIYQHNKINTLLSRQSIDDDNGGASVKRAIIPIKGGNTNEFNLQRSASSTSSTSTSSMASTSSSGSGAGTGSGCLPKRGRTLIRLDYEKEKLLLPQQQQSPSVADNSNRTSTTTLNSPSAMLLASLSSPPTTCPDLVSHEAELLKILRNPVEAVKHNLVPHICGRNESNKDNVRAKKMKDDLLKVELSPQAILKPIETISFIAKLLEDPTLGQVADGLEADTIAELIENSLKRLQTSRQAIDTTGTKDNEDMNRLINISLQKIREERQARALKNQKISTPTVNTNTSSTNAGKLLAVPSTPMISSTTFTPTTKEDDRLSNRGSVSSANSFASAHNYEMFDFDANESDCYQSCSSELAASGILEEQNGGDENHDPASLAATRSKFYQMLVDATLAEIEHSTNNDADVDHHYESIRHNGDPIYEEIGDVPPPLPLTAPPLNDPELDKKTARSIFEGATKYDILSYLVDAKERGLVREETFDYPQNPTNPIIIEEEAADTLSDLDKRKHHQDRSSRASILSDSSEDNQNTMSSLSPPPHNFMSGGSIGKGAASDIERNDSGVGSETSKTSRSRFQQHTATTVITNQSGNPLNSNPKNSPLHLCEDCDGAVDTQLSDSGVMFAPLVCRKCGKKRVERKEIITEIVETEEKYGRDLQIILEEFCHPMLVAGLLTQEQLSAIFLNTEELLENNQTLAERMRDALDIALEQGDDDLLTVNIGRIFLDFTQMLHAFESYCVRQAGASLLLANLEKEKELLRIFLKVSQMENAVLRRMNLNSFLMVPVQRVTKYPLLLARLYKVTPTHLDGRDLLKQAQEKIELHLNHINQEAKDVPTKLWRRISSSSPNRRASCEIDMINIKLRKMAIDILEWNHDEVRFAMEGKLLYTQPTDSNWKKARTIKLTPVNALLVTNGKPSANYKAEKATSDKLNFPKHTGIREASLLVVKEKCGRYTLIREPLYLDRCVVCSEADWDDYFEVQEISSKDTFIFKAEDGVRTKQWYTQLQYHAQGMGAWRKRRNALANIMINGMLTRS